jgi:hypothetical protein
MNVLYVKTLQDQNFEASNNTKKNTMGVTVCFLLVICAAFVITVTVTVITAVAV